MDELFGSCVRAVTGSIALTERAGEPPSPLEVWDELRRRSPRIGCFPLGTAAERAVRRAVDVWSRRPAGSAAEERAERVHHLLALLVFELALLDLRGSSAELERDFGFWYHWHVDGRFRTLAEEAELRHRLWRASARKAAELLRIWVDERPDGRCPSDLDVDATLLKALDAGPRPRPGKLQRSALTVLGLRADDQSVRGHGPIRSDAREIVLHGQRRNTAVDLVALEGACGGRLDSRLRDLVEIATAFYVADIHIPRRSLFGRELSFLLPVRHPTLWHEQRTLLARIASFLTGNEVELRFSSLADGHEQRLPLRTSPDERCVSLFSGGLDSFAGAAGLLEQGRQPTFVSHASSPELRGLQRRVAGLLGVEPLIVSAGAHSRGVAEQDRLGRPPEQVLYQHGRSLLFLSLATAVALSNGIAELIVPENGPVALNPPFSEARFNTRTTHPYVLSLFAELVRVAFEVELAIVNPFELLTKGEVLARLDEPRLPGLRATSSCWSHSKVRPWAKHFGVGDFGGHHCGRCIPCVWRRAAVKRAGLEQHDDRYLWDAIPPRRWTSWLDREHFTVLLDLHRSCLNVGAARDDGQLLTLCPELDEIGPGSLADRLACYRRYALEIVDWFGSAQRMEYRLGP